MSRRGRPAGSFGLPMLAMADLANRMPVDYDIVRRELVVSVRQARTLVREAERYGLVQRVGERLMPGATRASPVVRATTSVEDKLAALSGWVRATRTG